MPPSWSETTRGQPYGEVNVSWTAVRGADSYIILRSLAYAGTYVEVARVTGTMWRDIDVELCGDTWYRIQSVSGGVVSAPTPIMYGSFGYRPVAPERVRASRATYSQSIRIDWAAVDDAMSYQILRSPTKDGPFAVIVSSVTDLYYVDEGLPPGQTFWYKVMALNPCGCSGTQESVSGSTSSP
jgi:fibronectin type 3 domain-containing protein